MQELFDLPDRLHLNLQHLDLQVGTCCGACLLTVGNDTRLHLLCSWRASAPAGCELPGSNHQLT